MMGRMLNTMSKGEAKEEDDDADKPDEARNAIGKGEGNAPGRGTEASGLVFVTGREGDGVDSCGF